MPTNEFEARFHRLDDLINYIKALPPAVTRLRISADKVYALLSEAGKTQSFLAAEIGEYDRRLMINKGVVHFERTALPAKIMPPARMPA